MSLPPAPGRRRWLIASPLIVVLLLGAAWSGFWFYASAKAGDVLTAWRERDARAGRHYACGQRDIGGYPFRFELICRDPTLRLADRQPPLSVKAGAVHIAAQVYDPTLLIAEIAGPVTAEENGTEIRADWTLAQVSLRGLPSAPQRLSAVVDGLGVGHQTAGVRGTFLRAKHIEVHARARSESSGPRPLLDFALELSQAEAPMLHPMTAVPFDFSAVAVLHGLDNLRPMPLAARLRQLQTAGGRLDITQARVQQGEVTAVGAGSLRLDATGRLDGELMLTVAGLDKVLPKLGIDQLVPQGRDSRRLEHAFDKLDRIIPGLGQMARNHAGAGLAAGLALIGKPAELDGRPATALPLRFAAGEVYLGPVHVGAVQPLF